jgi:hypothetical protein
MQGTRRRHVPRARARVHIDAPRSQCAAHAELGTELVLASHIFVIACRGLNTATVPLTAGALGPPSNLCSHVVIFVLACWDLVPL